MAKSTAELDARLPDEDLHTLLYCDDFGAMQTRFVDLRSAAAAQAGVKGSPFDTLAHLWPLLLALTVGLRITKTTSEIRQSGQRA